MEPRFDQEFDRSEWQRVLPLGPHGIAPLIQTSHRSRLPALGADLRRLSTKLIAAARSGVASGFWPIGMAMRPLLSAAALRARQQPRPLQLAHETARPGARRAVAARPLSRALRRQTIDAAPARWRQKEMKQSDTLVDIIAKHTATISVRRPASSGLRPTWSERDGSDTRRSRRLGRVV